MRRIIVSTVAALSVYLATVTNASAYLMAGMGHTPCSVFTAIHAQEGDEWSPMKHWMYGYLSGVNAAFEGAFGEDFLTDIHFDAVYKSSLRACTERPDELVGKIVNEFVARAFNP